MASALRISIVQAHLAWEDAQANRTHFDELLAPLKGKTDLIVLPEMFTTGFSMNAGPNAEPPGGPTQQWMQLHADRSGAAVTGSYICGENGKYFNRLLFVEPGGKVHTYDKRHLFTLAGEHKSYQPGLKSLTLTWKGWRIRPLICYDLRFPVWSRNTDEYDLLFYVANWPDKRREAWKTLLAARAIENQAYCLGVNRVGTDEKGHYYSGDSSMFDFSGRLLMQLTDQEAVVTLKLDQADQQAFRQKLNFLADRDHFLIQPSN